MAKKRTRVIRTRLGEREISLDSVIYFPHGLIGMEDRREFVLLPLGDESPFVLLQSVQDSGFGLLVTDPFLFLEDYDVRFDMAEKRILRLENMRQAAVLVTVTIPHHEPENLTLNLSGPIIINTSVRVGVQVPQIDPAKPTHFHPMKNGKGLTGKAEDPAAEAGPAQGSGEE